MLYRTPQRRSIWRPRRSFGTFPESATQEEVKAWVESREMTSAQKADVLTKLQKARGYFLGSGDIGFVGGSPRTAVFVFSDNVPPGKQLLTNPIEWVQSKIDDGCYVATAFPFDKRPEYDTWGPSGIPQQPVYPYLTAAPPEDSYTMSMMVEEPYRLLAKPGDKLTSQAGTGISKSTVLYVSIGTAVLLIGWYLSKRT